MITDAQLRKAAEKSSDLYLRYVEQDYNSTPPHEFSASFEKKIRKLRKRADHPYFYKTLHKAAAVILAILISGSAWLAVDTEARAAFSDGSRKYTKHTLYIDLQAIPMRHQSYPIAQHGFQMDIQSYTTTIQIIRPL